MRTVLVTGFGAFPGVEHNPTADLARAVDGAHVADVQVVGRVLPVSWSRGPAAALAAVRALSPSLVIGLGVAVKRSRVEVERCAVLAPEGPVDVDGSCASGLHGPPRLRATLDVDRLAAALGAGLSDDAGRYLCNALLYVLVRELDVPAGFVHIPPAGLEPAQLLAGIRALVRNDG